MLYYGLEVVTMTVTYEHVPASRHPHRITVGAQYPTMYATHVEAAHHLKGLQDTGLDVGLASSKLVAAVVSEVCSVLYAPDAPAVAECCMEAIGQKRGDCSTCGAGGH